MSDRLPTNPRNSGNEPSRESHSSNSVKNRNERLGTSRNGTIKRLVTEKGFGFIAAPDGTEYFFHQSACTDTPFEQLRERQAVTFDVGQGTKGPRGENVKPA